MDDQIVGYPERRDAWLVLGNSLARRARMIRGFFGSWQEHLILSDFLGRSRRRPRKRRPGDAACQASRKGSACRRAPTTARKSPIQIIRAATLGFPWHPGVPR